MTTTFSGITITSTNLPMRTRLISLSWRLIVRRKFFKSSSIATPTTIQRFTLFQLEVCLNWLDRTNHVSHSQWLRPHDWLRKNTLTGWFVRLSRFIRLCQISLLISTVVVVWMPSCVRLLSKHKLATISDSWATLTWLIFIASTRSTWPLQPAKVLDLLLWRLLVQVFRWLDLTCLMGIKPLFKMGPTVICSLSLKIMLWMLSPSLIRMPLSVSTKKVISRPCVKNLMTLPKASWLVKSRQLGNSYLRRYAHDILMWLLQSSQ